MSLSFTRREFYDLVWSKPMIHLASELGVSDVALHKVCRKHHIPNPPLGWWAKKAAGKDVKQIPLEAALVSDLVRLVFGLEGAKPSLGQRHVRAYFSRLT